jgi:hypothetical protein
MTLRGLKEVRVAEADWGDDRSTCATRRRGVRVFVHRGRGGYGKQSMKQAWRLTASHVQAKRVGGDPNLTDAGQVSSVVE